MGDTLDLLEWKDLFPALASKKRDKLNFEISTLLYGMNLDKYKDLFRGMDLNTFLKLNEDDLEKLEMDIGIHRKKLIADLHRFHSKKWNMNSLGAIRKHLPYTYVSQIFNFYLILKNLFSLISNAKC